MDCARLHEGIRRMHFTDVLGRSKRSELSQMEAAELLGISERTFRRWRDRHRDSGQDGLADRPHVPLRHLDPLVRQTLQRLAAQKPHFLDQRLLGRVRHSEVSAPAPHRADYRRQSVARMRMGLAKRQKRFVAEFRRRHGADSLDCRGVSIFPTTSNRTHHGLTGKPRADAGNAHSTVDAWGSLPVRHNENCCELRIAACNGMRVGGAFHVKHRNCPGSSGDD